MTINNKNKAKNAVKNLKKIESIMKMWNNINFLINPKIKSSIQTLDIPIDTTIPLNDRKKTRNLKIQTIDNLVLIYSYIDDRTAQHLNHAQGLPFTMESLRILVGEGSFTTFSQVLLDDTSALNALNVSLTINLYLQQLKK